MKPVDPLAKVNIEMAEKFNLYTTRREERLCSIFVGLGEPCSCGEQAWSKSEVKVCPNPGTLTLRSAGVGSLIALPPLPTSPSPPGDVT